MKVIKVSVKINGRLQFSGYFTNYPTPGELSPYMPTALRGSLSPQALVQAMHPKKWSIKCAPYKVVQFISSFGVVVGKIEMKEVFVSDCVGFDPMKTASTVEAAAG